MVVTFEKDGKKGEMRWDFDLQNAARVIFGTKGYDTVTAAWLSVTKDNNPSGFQPDEIALIEKSYLNVLGSTKAGGFVSNTQGYPSVTFSREPKAIAARIDAAKRVYQDLGYTSMEEAFVARDTPSSGLTPSLRDTLIKGHDALGEKAIISSAMRAMRREVLKEAAEKAKGLGYKTITEAHNVIREIESKLDGTDIATMKIAVGLIREKKENAPKVTTTMTANSHVYSGASAWADFQNRFPQPKATRYTYGRGSQYSWGDEPTDEWQKVVQSYVDARKAGSRFVTVEQTSEVVEEVVSEKAPVIDVSEAQKVFNVVAHHLAEAEDNMLALVAYLGFNPDIDAKVQNTHEMVDEMLGKNVQNTDKKDCAMALSYILRSLKQSIGDLEDVDDYLLRLQIKEKVSWEKNPPVDEIVDNEVMGDVDIRDFDNGEDESWTFDEMSNELVRIRV